MGSDIVGSNFYCSRRFGTECYVFLFLTSSFVFFMTLRICVCHDVEEYKILKRWSYYSGQYLELRFLSHFHLQLTWWHLSHEWVTDRCIDSFFLHYLWYPSEITNSRYKFQSFKKSNTLNNHWKIRQAGDSSDKFLQSMHRSSCNMSRFFQDTFLPKLGALPPVMINKFMVHHVQ